MVKRVKIIGLFTVLICLILVFFVVENGGKIVRADLAGGRWAAGSDLDPDNSVIRLSGEWLVTPGDPGPSFAPVFGEMTYHCVLETPGVRGDMAFRMPRIFSAYVLTVNGREVFRSGVPGGTPETETPGGTPALVWFAQDSDELDIRISVSNWHGRHPGFFGGVPEYGTFHTLLQRDENLRGFEVVLVAVLFSFALIGGVWYFHHRDDNFYFFFALIFLAFILQRIVESYYAFPFLTRLVTWTGSLKGSLMLTLLSVPLIVGLARTFYPAFLSRRVFRYVLAVPAVVLSLGVAFLPGRLVPWIQFTGPLFLLAGTGAALVPVFRNRKDPRSPRRYRSQRNRLSAFYLLGMVLLIAAALNDLLLSFGLPGRGELLWPARVLFSACCLLLFFTRENLLIKNVKNINENLVEEVEGRDSLLLGISNEVGGTLDSVIELLRTISQGAQGPLNSEQLMSITLVQARAMHHQDLINDSLDILRLRDGGLEVNKGEVKLYSLLLMYLHNFSSILQGHNITIDHKVEQEIPYVTGDEKRLGQIINIFLFFGLRVMAAGTIGIHIFSEGERVFLSFSFKGGVDDSQMAPLMELFKSDLELKDVQDRGVPIQRLFLARTLIRLHGSEMELRYTPGEEVSIAFYLPVHRQSEEDGEILMTEEMARHMDVMADLRPLLEEVPSERGVSILVCSSDPYNLQILKNQLASMNYRVIPELGGMAALERIAQEVPDMVILDSELSDMSGYTVCREIREQYTTSDLPIIMIIEEKQASDVMESLTSGANDYLRRPYPQEEFLTRVNTHLQLTRISSVYSQFVPKEFLRCLGQNNIADIKLGDQVQQEMTILFVDIRAFTNLSENMTPQENFKFINSYLSQFTPIITRNGGFVDKYIGDAIMALYPQKPEDAIVTAIEMMDYVKVYNGYRAKAGYVPINIGVGIHTGNLILGIIGDSQRMQGTVISDAVNLASRIQDVTKLYQANIVISQETFVKLDNPTQFNFRFLGKVKVKGKAKSVSLFEIFNSDDDQSKRLKEETKTDFETGILLFAKRDFEEAEQHFLRVLKVNPDDNTAKLFLDRAQKFLAARKHSFLTSD